MPEIWHSKKVDKNHELLIKTQTCAIDSHAVTPPVCFYYPSYVIDKHEKFLLAPDFHGQFFFFFTLSWILNNGRRSAEVDPSRPLVTAPFLPLPRPLPTAVSGAPAPVPTSSELVTPVCLRRVI